MRGSSGLCVHLAQEVLGWGPSLTFLQRGSVNFRPALHSLVGLPSPSPPGGCGSCEISCSSVVSVNHKAKKTSGSNPGTG